MQVSLIFIAIILGLPLSLMSQEEMNDPIPFFKTVVYTLSDDSLHGRSPGTTDELKSLDFIEQKLTSSTKKKLRFHRQSFTIPMAEDSLRNATNGYFFINNRAKTTVIISAHYDHIGYGDGKSASFALNQIHNGADDNASGVSMVMALGAHLFNNRKNAETNFLVVFYSGHELGLYGSDVFSQMVFAKQRKFKKVVEVINFDMVGRMDKDLKILKCTSAFDSILANVHATNLGIKMNAGEVKQLGFLDTKPYFEKGISCLNFSTGVHLDYHKPSDDADYINFEGMALIYTYLLQILDEFYAPSLHRNLPD